MRANSCSSESSSAPTRPRPPACGTAWRPPGRARAGGSGPGERGGGHEAALATEVQSMISSLVQGAPEALAETKRFLAQLWHAPVPVDLERARTYHLSARNSAEAKEGIAAYNEKRAPNWAPK